ncbi:Flp pilus assembly complex ATPase component TadA, partial [bacterium]|nr:Flp pilus assembly complex ATPase component TadA [bacterium]
ASMIDYINANLSRHVITVEDPIEFLYKDKKSIVNQREVHIDTSSYSIALRHAMRQDPDVILIGEMRDIESFHIALAAAETGHIVLTTLHSNDTSGVFSRILDFFPPSQHHQIRMQLSLNLKAVICQRLIPRMDKDGMTPAVEILINTPVVSRLIRENRLDKIIAAIQGGAEEGMQTFNMSLVELCQKSFVSKEQAMANATNPEALKMNLQGIFLSEDKQILGG